MSSDSGFIYPEWGFMPSPASYKFLSGAKRWVMTGNSGTCSDVLYSDILQSEVRQ